MNILHTECSLDWGGQEYRTLLEHIYLNSHGHISWLLCHPNSKLFHHAVAMNAPNIVTINLRNVWRIDLALWIYWFCLRQNIDVINTHGTRDSLLCLPCFILRIPLIRSRQIINPLKKTFGYRYGCTHIFASAAKIKTMIEAIGVSSKKISVINEGVNLESYNPFQESAYLRKEFNLQPNDKVIINIGMIREDKGQRYFIEAAHVLLKERSDLIFFLIGEPVNDTKLWNELCLKIKEYGIEQRVIMTGYRQDISAFMNLAEFIVIASIEEAQSRIAPQAFASGKTVVSTNVGGLPEVVKNHETGLLVPPKDSQALAKAMSILLQDVALKSTLEKNAYCYAMENLCFSKMMQNIMKVYSQCCRKNTFLKELLF